MAIKERDIKKAAAAVGKGYDTKIAGKTPGGPGRTGVFKQALAEITAATPRSWKQIVNEAK